MQGYYFCCELNQNKNHETVIRAIAGGCLLYNCRSRSGQGHKKEYLELLAKRLGCQKSKTTWL